MYCPNCGDERATGSRFCPRCGLRLDGVTELLANNGALPTAAPAPSSEPSPRHKGTKQGTLLMFISVLLLPAFIAIVADAKSGGPLLVPLTVFLAGLFRLIYARIFYKDSDTSNRAALRPAVSSPSRLPEAQRADTTNPLGQASDAPARSLSPRRKGMKQGAKILFLSAVLLPIFFGLCWPADSPAPLLVPFTVFLAGIFWTLYHRLFSEDTAPLAAPVLAPPQMAASYHPPMRHLEAPPEAANALHPPSVLEHTTRNLESVPRTSPSQNPQH